jgi:hypothetical protein
MKKPPLMMEIADAVIADQSPASLTRRQVAHAEDGDVLKAVTQVAMKHPRTGTIASWYAFYVRRCEKRGYPKTHVRSHRSFFRAKVEAGRGGRHEKA